MFTHKVYTHALCTRYTLIHVKIILDVARVYAALIKTLKS